MNEPDTTLLSEFVHLAAETGGERLARQLGFIVEIEKMKSILRRTLLADSSRRENDAEHSWHLAIAALLLCEYTPAPAPAINILKTLKMTLVHDLVEIYAGDTFAYDAAGNADKAARERESADRLFSRLPDEQGAEIRSLWEEFDAESTIEAKYAASLDRFMPLLNNFLSQGYAWKSGAVDSAAVYRRMDVIRTGLPALWPVVEGIIRLSVEKGFLNLENS